MRQPIIKSSNHQIFKLFLHQIALFLEMLPCVSMTKQSLHSSLSQRIFASQHLKNASANFQIFKSSNLQIDVFSG